MSTRMMLKVIQKHVEWNRYMGNCPMSFDTQTGYLKCTRDLYKLKRYYLEMYYFLATFNGGALVLVLGRQHFSPTENFSIIHYFTFLAALLLVGLGLGIGISIFWYGKPSKKNLNDLAIVYKRLQIGHLIQKGPIWMHDGKPDIMGIIMMALVTVSKVVPFFATASVTFRLEPFSWFMQDWTIPSFYNMWEMQLFIRVASWIILFINVGNVCRLLEVMMIVMVTSTQNYLMGIEMLDEMHDKMKSKRDYLTHHYFFQQMRIINNASIPMVAPSAFFLSRMGILLSSIVTFAAIKFYSLVPLSFYLLFLGGGIATFLLIGMIMPYGLFVHENSNAALERWKGQIKPQYRVIRRKYRALQSVRFYQGVLDINSFLMDNSLNSEYYQSILDDTINLLVSIPDHTIQKLRIH